MSRSRSMGGVYQPRARKMAFADALAEARLAVFRALRIAMVRSSGAILFLFAITGIVAIASYNSLDPSFDNATGREASNLLGRYGAIEADLLLQIFGLAALSFLAAPAVWAVTVMDRGGVTENLSGEPGRDATRYFLGCCSLPAVAAGALLLAARHWGGSDEPPDASAKPE